MNTFERYLKQLEAFVQRILDTHPTFIVPVAKKGAKLLRLTTNIEPRFLRYRSHFDMFDVDLRGARVAVVDDATQHTSGLMAHRRYFESKGAFVDTYSFVGHDELYQGRRWMYDTSTHVEIFLPAAVYQEYILQQARHLLGYGHHFDLDHLVIKFPLERTAFDQCLGELRRIGLLQPLLHIGDPEGVERYSLDDIRVFKSLPYLNDPSISIGPIRKAKLLYDSLHKCLYLNPLVFPAWSYRAGELTAANLRQVPFELPLELPIRQSRNDSKGRQRTYAAVNLAYQISLLKAVCQASEVLRSALPTSSLRESDLSAAFGVERASAFAAAAHAFVKTPANYDFSVARSEWIPMQRPSRRFDSFAQVVDVLKEGYRAAVQRSKQRIGVQHAISYGALFSGCEDRVGLFRDLDAYCDLGVIVPVTLNRNGVLERGCRTGEVEDISWTRTGILVPLAIQQFAHDMGNREPVIGPTVLNKILGNFQFDYPAESYPDLHCLLGQPDWFGTLVHAYHQLRAPTCPTIYEARKISDYYRYDQSKQRFRVLNAPAMFQKARLAFDDQQEVPYSEIITYFRFLNLVYRIHKRVDILNALSICREENYFLAHARHNLACASAFLASAIGGLQNFSGAKGVPGDTSELDSIGVLVGDAATHASSCGDKVRLKTSFPQLLKSVLTPAGEQPEFLKVVEKIERSTQPFSSSFGDTLKRIGRAAALQRISAVALRAALSGKLTDLRALVDASATEEAIELGIDLPRELGPGGVPSSSVLSSLGVLIQRAESELRLLPDAEPILQSRILQAERQRAKNLAVARAYEQSASAVCIFFIDLSGLRDLGEERVGVVGQFYHAAKEANKNRGGVLLYGGRGGDDELVWSFETPFHAIECAKTLKRIFANDLLLSKYDVKMGMGVTLLNGDKEREVVRAWGKAKDCCTYKSETFRNKGHLLVSESSITACRQWQGMGLPVTRIEGEELGGEPREPLFSIDGIVPLH